MKEIQLSQGKVALVDDADYEWLNQWKWYAHKRRNTFYAMRNITKPDGKRGCIYMHREILGLEPGDSRQSDHKNLNGLDNRRDKLRICTNQQNHFNMKPQENTLSQFKGVSWHKRGYKWEAQIKSNGKAINLGLFTSEVEAAKTYDRAAIKHFKEFANLNFPEGRQVCAS